jgi:hypothetical protein
VSEPDVGELFEKVVSSTARSITASLLFYGEDLTDEDWKDLLVGVCDALQEAAHVAVLEGTL